MFLVNHWRVSGEDSNVESFFTEMSRFIWKAAERWIGKKFLRFWKMYPWQDRTAAPWFPYALRRSFRPGLACALWRGLCCTPARPAALCGRLCAPVSVPALLWHLCPPGHSKAAQGPAGRHEKPRQAVGPVGAVLINWVLILCGCYAIAYIPQELVQMLWGLLYNGW